ncbi:hypothetical protein [uncultured Cohaesibacter sp.]|uniref:hypothetical protein n=1 Tax=uncultured Cohaesibacter sp. TaxID=1002546 RepID=UPI0029C96FAF|nr:hypothetical protein [uncultured Cohaesibacter sp.]
MFKALRYFWKEQPIALSLFALALVCLLFFGVRFVDRFLYFHDPAHRNQALEPWMTPRYVGISYQLPKDVIFQVMELYDTEGRRVRVGEIADRMGISLDELEARVRKAKVEFIAQRHQPKAPGKGMPPMTGPRGAGEPMDRKEP